MPTVLETCCFAASYLVGSGNVAGCVTYVLGACGPSYVLVVDLGLACCCSGGSGFGILGEKSITKKVDTTKQKIVGERQLGGPVAKDKAYLVGEVGPEVFIPKVSGKIVSNDDSKIINLLLEANPNLKGVSPARAEKILRNRFPDYFE